MLRGPEGARLRAIATLGDQSNRTAKAIAWIRANYAKPLRVEDLAHVAGVGVSTLHHHFRSLTAMSPVQYQKQLRLQAARGRMLIDGLDAATGRRSRWDTKARVSLIANTAFSSASRRCGHPGEPPAFAVSLYWSTARAGESGNTAGVHREGVQSQKPVCPKSQPGGPYS